MLLFRFLARKRITIFILCYLLLFTVPIISYYSLPIPLKQMTFEMNIESNHLSLVQTFNTSLPYSLEWYRIWGGPKDEYGCGIAADIENNVYLAGSTCSFGAGDRDIYLIKYDSKGNRLWNITWGGPNFETGSDIVVDNNDVYFTGFMDGVGGYDGFYVKYNTTGAQYWNRTWSGSTTDGFKGIAVDLFKNIYLIGSIWINTSAILLVKYDSTGLQLWNQTWDGIDNDYGNSIAIDNYNNFYIAGDTQSFNTNYDFDALILKYNSTGNQLWNRSWGSSEYDFGKDIAVDAYNNCYLAGYTYCSGVGFADAFLAKYDSTGNQLWNRTWGLTWNEDFCYGVAVEGNDSYLTGYTYNSVTKSDTFLVKFDSAGNQVWNKTWDINQYEKGSRLTIDANKNIYLTGFLLPSDEQGLPYSDAFLVKYGIDTDNDGLTDNVEINIYHTNPNNPDTDNDGLNDGIEVNITMTDPKNWDTDGDGYSDGWEWQNNYDPLNAFSNPRIIIILSAIIPITVMAIILYPIIFKRKKRERI